MPDFGFEYSDRLLVTGGWQLVSGVTFQYTDFRLPVNNGPKEGPFLAFLR